MVVEGRKTLGKPEGFRVGAGPRRLGWCVNRLSGYCRFHQINAAACEVDHAEQEAFASLGETEDCHVMDVLKKRLPEVVDIDEDDRPRMQPKLAQRKYLDQFLECSVAAWQDDEGVGPGDHLRLTFSQCVGDHQLTGGPIDDEVIEEATGYDNRDGHIRPGLPARSDNLLSRRAGAPTIVAMSRLQRRGASVNGALLEAFRHNSWATGQLLAFCRDLSEEQLAASGTGTYGSIRATFNHLVLSDGRYLRRLAGGGPAWVDRPDDDADLEELAAWAEEAGQLWERLLSEPVDAERVVVVDDGAVEVRAGVIVAQALHHGNAHREQICATLTSLGIEPPDIQPWEYAWATGRMWERTAAR